MNLSEKKNLLLTGVPGVGKTTLVRRIVDGIKDKNCLGFYTAEIRESGGRKGFELVSLKGEKSVLSHVNINSPHRVGKYGVDIDGFDIFLDKIDFFNPATDLIVIDEIGKMECFSPKFVRCINTVLSSETRIVATIALKGGGLIQRIKAREDCVLFEVTRSNRNRLASEIVSILTE